MKLSEVYAGQKVKIKGKDKIYEVEDIRGIYVLANGLFFEPERLENVDNKLDIEIKRRQQ